MKKFYGMSKTEGNVMKLECRVSYARFIEPQEQTTDDGAKTGKYKFSCCALISKDDAKAIAAYNDGRDHAIKAGVEKNLFKAAAVKLPTFKGALADGDLAIETGARKPNNGYEGCFFFNPSTYAKVVDYKSDPITGEQLPVFEPLEVFKREGKRLVPAGPNDVYSGCYGILIVVHKPYKHARGGVGTTSYLQGFIKISDGPRLDGSVSTSEVAGELADMMAEAMGEDIETDDLEGTEGLDELMDESEGSDFD